MSRATSLGSSGNWLMSGVQPAQPSMQGHSLDEARHAVSKHWQPWMAIDIDVFKQQMVLGVLICLAIRHALCVLIHSLGALGFSAIAAIQQTL